MSKRRKKLSRGAPSIAAKGEIERRGATKSLRPEQVLPPKSLMRPTIGEDVSPAGFERSYDLDLLDRARHHWRTGDWTSLRAISDSDIEQHPDRERLALLVATGHQAAGNSTATRNFAQLAMQWGCDRELVARALIGGVHNTLGRATVASGRAREHVLRHFDLAVAPGGQGSSHHTTLQARLNSELGQMGLKSEPHIARAANSNQSLQEELSITLKRLSEDTLRATDALGEALKVQRNEMAISRKYLDEVIKREVNNATRQLEAFVNLQGYITAGKLVPDVHGWAVSPDFALLLLRLVRANNYDLIIEFGSGSSTLLLAVALARNAELGQDRGTVNHLAFEHLKKYHAATESLLKDAGLAATVELLHTPLVPYTARDGRVFEFYDCRPRLSAFGDRFPPIGKAARVLMLVDGPPAATGAHARYPALPIAREFFSEAKVDVVMDDYARNDEKEILKIWISELQSDNVTYTLEEFRLEKGACLLSV